MRTELAIGAIAIGGAGVFAAAVFVWRVVFDDSPVVFPALPSLPTENAFEILPWVALFVYAAMTIIAILAVIRRDARWVAPAMAIVISAATASLYLPVWFFRTTRIDRLRGEIEEPVRRLQFLAAAVMLTLLLSVLLIVITRLRHTPAMTRLASLVASTLIAAGLLHLFWLVLVLPIANVWRPLEWDRPDLLIPVRPCRGAVVWAWAGRNYTEIGAIDDIWLHFADPRNGKAPTFAVSVGGHWRAEYFWLNSSDFHWMRVRKDDPAVVDCDSRTRPEPVAPAPWHKLGYEW